jgi:hypothetical protein
MKKATQHVIAEVPRRQPKLEMTIGIDLGMSGAITARSTKRERFLARPASGHVEGHREVIDRPASGACGHGNGNAFDLDQ